CNDVMLQHYEGTDDEQEGFEFPSQSIDIWSFSATRVKLPQKYAKPFLNNLSDDLEVNLLYNFRGSLHYKAKERKVTARIKAEPSIGDTSPFLFDARVTYGDAEKKVRLMVDAQNPPEGSNFIQLPVDQMSCRLDLDLVSMKGAWQLSGMKQKEKKTIFPEC